MTTGHARERAALEHLAAALDPREFATVLVTGSGRPPRLAVARRTDGHTEDIHADRAWYWWAWAEPIAATDDPLAAARQVATVLRAVPQSAHDR